MLSQECFTSFSSSPYHGVESTTSGIDEVKATASDPENPLPINTTAEEGEEKEEEAEAEAEVKGCHQLRTDYKDVLISTRFWMWGVGVPFIGIFGIVGNVVTIIVLRRLKTNTNFNNLLIGLGIFDIMVIVLELIDIPLIMVGG